VNTGDGKGKSTAAFGTAMRAAAAGWRVCVVQFVKSGKRRTGEQDACATLGIDRWTGDGFTWDSSDMDETEAVAREGWRKASELLGRDAPAELIVIADTLTEMRNEKHAFDQGVRAMRGIDF
jgi:cob(I)alamin adenosyltransferase